MVLDRQCCVEVRRDSVVACLWNGETSGPGRQAAAGYSRLTTTVWQGKVQSLLMMVEILSEGERIYEVPGLFHHVGQKLLTQQSSTPKPPVLSPHRHIILLVGSPFHHDPDRKGGMVFIARPRPAKVHTMRNRPIYFALHKK